MTEEICRESLVEPCQDLAYPIHARSKCLEERCNGTCVANRHGVDGGER
jgi:hypothetical protein